MDDLFDLCDQDENYIPIEEGTSTQATRGTTRFGDEDENMNQFRDWIANGLFAHSRAMVCNNEVFFKPFEHYL